MSPEENPYAPPQVHSTPNNVRSRPAAPSFEKVGWWAFLFGLLAAVAYAAFLLLTYNPHVFMTIYVFRPLGYAIAALGATIQSIGGAVLLAHRRSGNRILRVGCFGVDMGWAMAALGLFAIRVGKVAKK